MNNLQQQNCYKILKSNTTYTQKLKTVEELTELQELIIKDVNKKERNKEELLDEIADVHIMLEQLRVIYSFSQGDISKRINDKLNRQLKRIIGEAK